MPSNIYNELHEGNLVEAFVMLETKTDGLNSRELRQELEQAQSTYAGMLGYLVKGVEDPEWERIRQNIIQQAYSINDKANLAIRLKKSPFDKFCQAYTENRTEPLNIIETQVALETLDETLRQLHINAKKRKNIQHRELEETIKQHDILMEKFFNSIWTSDIWTKSDYTNHSDLLNSELIYDTDKAVIISAVTLATYELFDQQKIMFLFDAYIYKDVEVSQRALVGLILLFIRYNNRLNYYPQITNRFNLYSENKQFVQSCFRIFMQLQYSKLTDTVSAKMNNDIMPAILQSSKYSHINIGDLDAELTKNGENPEWHQTTKRDSKAEKKMRQMADMQMEGADVYWTSFCHLKSFPFFLNFYHWLCPFSFDYNEVYQLKYKLRPEILSILYKLFDASPFCSSDKFSFMFMIEGVQNTGQDIIMDQIQSQLEEGPEDLFESEILKQKNAKDISRYYIYDLYRLFKAYPYHAQFFDPFNKQLNNFSPLNVSLLKILIDNNHDEVLTLAEFMMRKEVYNDALELFYTYNPVEREEDADIWQEMGFCLQKTGKGRKALDMYLNAYKLQPESKWTLQHIAQTAFEINDYKTAIQYIDIILKDDENNIKWIIKKAECMFGLELYEESLPILYKAVYLDEKSERTQEMPAWAHIMTGNIDKAEKIYQELQKNNPSVKNTINLAHILFHKGQLEDAYKLYHKAYISAENDEQFIKTFWAWRSYMDKIGIDAKKLQVMFDAVRTI